MVAVETRVEYVAAGSLACGGGVVNIAVLAFLTVRDAGEVPGSVGLGLEASF